jgi:hypothetical protein
MHKYGKAEKVMVFNEDKDLDPIEYKMPDCPPLEQIYGYGLDPLEQFWQHKPMPPKLVQLQRMSHTEPTDTEKARELSPRLKVEMLEADPIFYQDEIEYIQNEWERTENGFWFFNKGIPTYITGAYYFYLQCWKIDGRHPQYRERDRRWFQFWQMCYEDDFCSGFNNPKQRREGATTRVSALRIYYGFRTPYFSSGLQSKDDEHASKVHEFYVWNIAKELPFFFMPIMSTRLNEVSSIKCFSPNTKDHPDKGQPALNSMLDYSNSQPKAYDGTKQWFIHNDEVGKMEEQDINDRIAIQLPCLLNLQLNSPKRGKIINTSTVDEMDKKGGKEFKKLCDNSMYHDRNDNGMTKSELFTLFQSVLEGREGIDPKTKLPFIDKYGHADKDAIMRYTLTQQETKKKISVAAFIEECRLFPLYYSDCWRSSAKNCNFNVAILEEVLDRYRNGNPDLVQGNFYWENGKGSRVKFQPTENGRFFVSYQFADPLNQANKRVLLSDGGFMPGNRSKFIAGGDPFKHDTTRKKQNSKGAGAVFMKYNLAIDGAKKSMADWETHRFVCTYAYRPPTKEEYGTDMIMMCVYFGCEMFAETNVTFLRDYFISEGYANYLYFKFDSEKNRLSDVAGQHTGEKTKQQIYLETESHIEQHGLREKHDDLVLQWKELEGDLGKYDLAVAAGLCLIAANADGFSNDEETSQTTDISDYFQQYTYPS